MNASRTYIPKEQRTRLGRLHLQIEVPLCNVISVRMWLDIGVAQGCRVLRELNRACGEGQRRKVIGCSVFKERRYAQREKFELVRQGKNIEESGAGTHHKTPIAEGVPGPAKP